MAEVVLETRDRIIFSLILSVIIVTGCFANVIVLWVLAREKQLRRNIATMFLINLLIIDLSNLILVMPFSLAAVLSTTWYPPRALQQLNAFLGTSVELVAMLALAVISLDRLVAVMKPLAYKARMTICKATQCNVYIWSQAVLFSFLPIPLTWYTFNGRYMACTFLSSSGQSSFYVFMAFLITCNFILSLCVILATYLYIFRVARSHNRRISRAILPARIFNLTGGGTDNSRKETFRQREIRTATKILCVIGAFIICHLPYACLRIVELCRLNDEVYANIPPALTIATKWAAYSKSSFNPFIYFLQQKRFREAFVKLFRQSSRCSNSNETKNSLRKSAKNTLKVSPEFFTTRTIHNEVSTRGDTVDNQGKLSSIQQTLVQVFKA